VAEQNGCSRPPGCNHLPGQRLPPGHRRGEVESILVAGETAMTKPAISVLPTSSPATRPSLHAPPPPRRCPAWSSRSTTPTNPRPATPAARPYSRPHRRNHGRHGPKSTGDAGLISSHQRNPRPARPGSPPGFTGTRQYHAMPRQADASTRPNRSRCTLIPHPAVQSVGARTRCIPARLCVRNGEQHEPHIVRFDPPHPNRTMCALSPGPPRRPASAPANRLAGRRNLATD
jgi:hypothetical protein